MTMAAKYHPVTWRPEAEEENAHRRRSNTHSETRLALKSLWSRGKNKMAWRRTFVARRKPIHSWPCSLGCFFATSNPCCSSAPVFLFLVFRHQPSKRRPRRSQRLRLRLNLSVKRSGGSGSTFVARPAPVGTRRRLCYVCDDPNQSPRITPIRKIATILGFVVGSSRSRQRSQLGRPSAKRFWYVPMKEDGEKTKRGCR